MASSRHTIKKEKVTGNRQEVLKENVKPLADLKERKSVSEALMAAHKSPTQLLFLFF